MFLFVPRLLVNKYLVERHFAKCLSNNCFCLFHIFWSKKLLGDTHWASRCLVTTTMTLVIWPTGIWPNAFLIIDFACCATFGQKDVGQKPWRQLNVCVKQQWPLSFGQQAFGQESFGQESFGQETFGRESFGKESFGWESFGWDSFGQESFGQESSGQESFGQQSFGRESFGQPIRSQTNTLAYFTTTLQHLSREAQCLDTEWQFMCS